METYSVWKSDQVKMPQHLSYYREWLDSKIDEVWRRKIKEKRDGRGRKR